jgi:para-aminobenzoate synthetase component I
VHAALSGAPSCSLEFTCSTFSPNETKKQYLESMARIREYLLAGDCYQVNYTQRFSAQFSGSPVGAYLRLRQTVPSPFSAYLDTGDRTLLSVSPERFIRVHDRAALTQPIKGTTRRGLTDSEDLALKEELRRSEKNRAENVMIVDLLRNDFGQVCETGSVKVPNLMDIHSFANVHHLVSTITGTLPVGIRHSDLIFSCFPGGSITGAPKRRAMEIIEELEHQRRSAYCGSIGYFSCNNNTDFNIAIRTMEQKHDQIHAWAGGGIVIDSEGEAEYEECFAKISIFMRSLENR